MPVTIKFLFIYFYIFLIYLHYFIIYLSVVHIVLLTAQVVNVKRGSETITMNLGGASDTVNVASTLTYINTSNLEVTNNTITTNENGGTGSAGVKKVLQSLLESVPGESFTTQREAISSANCN